MATTRDSSPPRAVNEFFLSEEFVRAHLAQTDAIPVDLFRLTFVDLELGRRLTAPRVLDIGCGGAHATRAFAEAFERFSYVGVDFSAPMLAQARQRYPALSFVRGRFDRTLPFRDESFDLVYFRDFLIHVQYPYDLVAEALRVSRRFIAFNVPAIRIGRDLELRKVRSAVRYNFLSWDRLLAFLRGRGDLTVRAAAFKNRGYDPPEYVSVDGRPWVAEIDRAGGAKDVNVLIEKRADCSGFRFDDCTACWRHRGFLSRLNPIDAVLNVLSGGVYPHRLPPRARRLVRALLARLL